MTDATLISCTGTKRDHEAPARMLYDESAYFRKMRAWAESRGCEWFILSAKHGLLSPDEPVAPYDERGLSEEQAEQIAFELDERAISRVYVCAGRDYLDTLTPALEAVSIDVVDPFAGMRIGERMNALTERTDA
ncbi:peroxide stress protein YaaA [Halorubrum tailed virus 29]|uniref:Peroxide stress protein YaaA n=1 Tax=Halorubrum tailed virus 29 TaxID=2878010 RepID=A0AAE8XZ30_9CAUD|nr:peroxide stress protein YaaA [Halorubrum tailed virus 29]UBF23310.1 peroxide stress protein YaaA [Halorubrum tailed virus 29]